jgi:alpha-beta hydrolase superfamily lysophospholipase
MRRQEKSWLGWEILLLGSAISVGVALTLLCWSPARRQFVHKGPAKPLPYDEAVKQIEALIDDTPVDIRPECAVQLFEHGHPTKRVFVLLHGLSNCPAQFTELGRLLFERGHNVFISRIPYHGKEDRLTKDWARLTAEGMLESANQAVDLALSLGSRVTVAGLSISGVTVAWMAQNRSDLDRAVLLAPFFAPFGVPVWAQAPLNGLLLRLPNMFLWWNRKERENIQGPPYVYPRFPTRVIGETMLLGREVVAESRHHAPQCPSILVVTTAADTAADNRVTAKLLTNWRRSRHTGLESFQFPVEQRVPHDFIDPNQPNQRTALVYPKIIELLEEK